MEWISIEKRLPIKKDSPILVADNDDEFFSYIALRWLSEEKGWDGEGWYDHSDAFWIKVASKTWWMPLPKKPKIE